MRTALRPEMLSRVRWWSGARGPILRTSARHFSSTSAETGVSRSATVPQYVDRYGDLLTVSGEVMKTIISEALQRKDSKTLHMVIAQANKVGNLSINVLEDSIRQCLRAKDYVNAAFILESCGLLSAGGKGVVSQDVCEDLLFHLVNNCKWEPASVVMEYMVRNDIPSTSGDRDAFHVVGGLLKDIDGTVRALQLMASITEKRRSDFAQVLSFRKANRFAFSMGMRSPSPDRRQTLPREALEHLSQVTIKTLHEHGWFSFTLSKMFVALSCGSGNHDLTIDFMEKALREVCAATAKGAPSSRRHIDVLSLLRAFSQGAGVASDDPTSYKGTWFDSPASRAILKMSVEQLERGTIEFSGPLQTMQFLKMYWVLCHRAGRGWLDVHSPPLQQQQQQQQQQRLREEGSEQKVDSFLRSSYDELVGFLRQSDSKTLVSRPTPGAHRRVFRILCDELGLRHKLGKFEESVDEVVRVHKEVGSSSGSAPPTLEDILRADARRGNLRRKFDGSPSHWNVVLKHLRKRCSPEELQVILTNVTHNMFDYPSSEWGLLSLQALYDLDDDSGGGGPDLEASASLLRNVIKMSSSRNDVYGLLEVLHLSARRTNNNPSFRNKERREQVGDAEVPLGLRTSDWNLACHVAFHSREAGIPPASFDSAFSEVVRLMREANVEFEEGTMRTLLRYLVYSQPAGELTARITKRLSRDKSIKLSHIECAALTYLLKRRLSNTQQSQPGGPSDKISMTKPLFMKEHYLMLYPEGFRNILDLVVKNSEFLGVDFLNKFEAAWGVIHTQQGRNDLFKLLVDTTSSSPSGRRKELVEAERDEPRAAVSLLCIYAAFLMSFHHSAHRGAYDLLFACESIFRDAEALAREKEESLWAGDDVVGGSS